MASDKLNQAAQLIKAGNKQAAIPLLKEFIQSEPNNETAWLWLYACLEDPSQKKYCLQKALEINPANQNARNELEKLSITNSTPSTPQSVNSSNQSLASDQYQVKKFTYYMSVIVGAVALAMIALIFYLIITKTKQTITLSATNRAVDAYLTAIEHDNWQAAYDYLCPEIQAQIHTPDEMHRRILIEIGNIPDSHTFLPPPDRPYRVLFILSRKDGWVTGIREARLEEGSLKICGVGPEHGDLRYLLQPDNIGPLNINP
jgi:tetratricopeptide (TPR) repeat protein